MASDELTSDKTGSDESDESGTEESNSTESESSESKPSSEETSLDFGSGAAEESEPPADETESSEESESPEASEDSEDSEEPYDPSKIPPLTARATLFGAWGCVGLIVVVVLIFFVLIKSAIDKIDDYGAVASEESTDEEPTELPPPEQTEEPATPSATRTLEWPAAYPAARAAARIDLRPIVIVFTAEYASESLDVFDGVFANDDVESYLERYYQLVHIDMGAQGAEPDPSIALCEVEFLPHVCYLHPETEAKLSEDTTGMVGTSALLRDLATAYAAYEASAAAE